MATLRVGTRGSALARWQTERVREALAARGVATEAVEISTTGDEIVDVPLARIGAVALFTRQLDEALRDGRIDLAVHSLKDLPSRTPEGIALAAVSVREDPRDALVGRGPATLATLPQGATVATSSVRRKAQLLRARPDLHVVDVRGNVPTRLRRLRETPAWDATLLAVAGLVRLDLDDAIGERIDPAILLPAPGQGALAVTARRDDAATIALAAAAVHDAAAGIATGAERSLLRTLDGGCQVPVAAYAEVLDGRVTLRARVVSLDGRETIEGRLEGDLDEAEAIGVGLGERLLAEGAGPLLAAARAAHDA